MPSRARILTAGETLKRTRCDLIAPTLDVFELLGVKGLGAGAPGRGVKVGRTIGHEDVGILL